jgi:hypothetical protein
MKAVDAVISRPKVPAHGALEMQPGRAVFVSLCNYAGLALIFILGFWFIGCAAVRGGRLPGDLGDGRLNIYFLEHIFRWVTGRDSSLWTAPFFAGYSYTFAFSSNHLGSFPIYFLGRIAGLDPASAFQGWYAVNFLVNFVAASYVLLKMKLSPLASGTGAFIFTFGLPVLVQNGHPQLLYRFCVPLACYCLMKFAEERRLGQLLGIFAWFVWQTCIEIYTGIFLAFLLIAMAAVIAWRERESTVPEALLFWPGAIAGAWKAASARVRLVTTVGTAALTVLLAGILWPYSHVTQLYGLKRQWTEIETMIPRLQSYLLCGTSPVWRFTSDIFRKVPKGGEQQLFIGAGAMGLALIGSIWIRTPHRKAAVVNAAALLLLFLFTLHLGPHSRYTPYRMLTRLPGLSAIRAVSRIILVMLWPAGVLAAIGLEELLRSRKLLFRCMACILLVVTFIESAGTSQAHYSKVDAAQRLTELRTSLPHDVPESPVLLVREREPTYLFDLDAMLLSQSLGWSALNGYTGNVPPGWSSITECSQFPKAIALALLFDGRLNQVNYLAMAHRVVAVGFEDCRPEYWQMLPPLSIWPGGPLPQDLMRKVKVRVLELIPSDKSVRARLEIENDSNRILPSRYRDAMAFYLSGRLVDERTGVEMSGFDLRRDLDADVPPRSKLTEDIVLPIPRDGRFVVEASAVQEAVAWIQDFGVVPGRSAQGVEVSGGVARLVEVDGPQPKAN